MTDVDFCTYLKTLAGSSPVEQNLLSEDKTQPRVFFQRREQNTDLFLDGSTALTTAVFDVEVGGLDIDTTATLADSVKAAHGHKGTVGSSSVLAMFVEDASDDYIPKMLNEDVGFNIFSMQFTIIF